MVYPRYESFREVRDELEVKSEELENIMHYVSEMKIIEQNMRRYSRELVMLEKAFPSDHDAPALFFYLDNAIRRHNLQGEGLGPYSVSSFGEHPRIEKVAFSLMLTGNYENIKNFFADIEGVIRIIKVNNMTISYEDEDNLFRVSFSAHTYSTR